MPPGGPDVADDPVVSGKDPAVEGGVAAAAQHVGIFRVQRKQICKKALGNLTRLAACRLRAAPDRLLDQHPACRPFRRCEGGTRAVAQALGIVEGAQLFGE